MISSLKITLSLIKRSRPDFNFKVHRKTPVAHLKKPLNQCTLALVTTGGLHLKDDRPFDLGMKNGDCSYRMLPGDITHDNIALSHKWYNHKFINKDLNCVFPIDRMREYVTSGILKALSPEHYSFMGHIYKPGPLGKYAKKAGKRLRELGVDAALITPTWVLCNQSVGLIARHLETSGISTVCVTFRPEITRLSSPPRILYVKSSAGKPMGNPGDRKYQQKIIESAFKLLVNKISGTVVAGI